MGIGGISIWQLLIILAIVVVLFGTKRLRNIGEDLGSAIRGFRSSLKTSEPEEAEDAKFDQPQVTAQHLLLLLHKLQHQFKGQHRLQLHNQWYLTSNQRLKIKSNELLGTCRYWRSGTGCFRSRKTAWRNSFGLQLYCWHQAIWPPNESGIVR